jgi:hypothetical protein
MDSQYRVHIVNELSQKVQLYQRLMLIIGLSSVHWGAAPPQPLKAGGQRA